jgi:ubiquinone biosynthesis protein
MEPAPPPAVPRPSGPRAALLHEERRPAQPPGFRLRALGIVPALRLAALFAVLAASRLAGLLFDPWLGPDRRALRRAARAEAEARRVARTLGDLKGAFAKLGQFASLRHDVVSEPLRRALATLRDRVPPLPAARVRAFVEGELRAPLEELFAEFGDEPLGAASIAQVHPARLPGGEPVAVKVQYPWLAASLRADVALLRLLFAAWGLRHPRGSVDRRRLFDEFAAGLAEELDFEREALVAEEIARNLADEPSVLVPRIISSRSTRRVLTMTRHAVVPVTDRAGLARLGVSPAEVLGIVTRAYARQIFVDGLFHADPHPGNLFVLDEPEAASRPRVLFLDFGLSRHLDPVLRRELRLGMLALLQGDLEAFLGGMERLNMIAPGAREGVRGAVSGMMSRVREAGALGMGGDRVLALKDEAKTLLQETQGLQLPNDLLLFAKTLSYVFGLGREIAPEADVMRLCVPWLLRFLARSD